jgi:acylphosphatase
MERVFAIIHGIVQGVGYRYFVRSVAEQCHVHGFVRNMEDGSVEVLAEAEDRNLLEVFLKAIAVDMEHGPQVFSVDVIREDDKRFPERLPVLHQGFDVIESGRQSQTI